MNTDDIIAQLDEQIAHHLSEVAKLQAARKALRGGVKGSNGTTPDTNPAPKAKMARKAKGRAPAGALEEAMQQALKAKPGLTNGEVREALEQTGYRWSLTPLHVGKRLSALVDLKALTVKKDGHIRRYYPAK